MKVMPGDHQRASASAGTPWLSKYPALTRCAWQITSLGVYKWNGELNEPCCLGAAQDLSTFGYFQRSTVKEMLLFVSRTIVKRTQPGQRQSVEHNGASSVCAECTLCVGPPPTLPLTRHQSTSRTLRTWAGWPRSCSRTVNTPSAPRLECCSRRVRSGPPRAGADARPQLTDDVLSRMGERWRSSSVDSAENEELVTSALGKFQDPAAADKLLKIQRELDETKIVLHKTIDSVLARGEKLDNLVEKSSDLSMASQMFYKQARKSNSCCGMM